MTLTDAPIEPHPTWHYLCSWGNISKSRSAFTSAFTWSLFLFEYLSFLTRHFSTSAFLFRLLWSFLSTSFNPCLRYLFIIICSMFIKFFNAQTLSHAITERGTLARNSAGFNSSFCRLLLLIMYRLFSVFLVFVFSLCLYNSTLLETNGVCIERLLLHSVCLCR